MRTSGCTRTLAAASLGLGLVACASGGGLRPEHCEVRVARLERWDVRGGAARVAYEVTGRGGSAGRVWLAARNPSGSYVSGAAVPVGPGPFRAVVGLDLDRVPQEYVAVLDVAGRRCRADAPMP